MNLNIESYSKQDLIKLFSLKPNFDSKCVQIFLYTEKN